MANLFFLFLYGRTVVRPKSLPPTENLTAGG